MRAWTLQLSTGGVCGSVIAGLSRARKSGKRLGRPMVPASVEDAIRAQLAEGVGKVKVARAVGYGVGMVQRVGKAMEPTE